MAKLTKADVEKTAKLAHISLNSSEIEDLTEELGKVLTHVSEISKVNVPENLKPMANTTGILNSLRNDEEAPFDVLSQDEALSNAKKKHNGYFLTSALLEK